MKSKKLSIFLRVLGDSPKARVLEYLIETKGLDICLTDLAKNSRISRATLIRMWKDLIKERVIIPTRNVGRAKMFKLNEENQYIERLIEISEVDRNLIEIRTNPKYVRPTKTSRHCIGERNHEQP